MRLDFENTPVHTYADRARLERSLLNIVWNALKYSPREVPVVVRVRADDEHASIAIIDRGAGIAPQDLPHVFDKYFRATRTRSVEGTGLGLYIARMLIEADGGHLSAHSTLGEGSEFTIELLTHPPLGAVGPGSATVSPPR